MKNKTINDHMKWAKDNGFCEQCIHPWFDGICSCGNYEKHAERMDSITMLALEDDWDLNSEKSEKKRRKIEKELQKRAKRINKQTVDNPVWMNKLKDYVMEKMMMHFENDMSKE